MVVDTSVIVAIALREPDAESLKGKIDLAEIRLVSVASVLEAAIVLRHRFGDDGTRRLDELLTRLTMDVVAVDAIQLRWARFAVETFGRGQHPAKLNFGDCFSYALAKSSGEPILYKGTDFSLTDLAIV
jgi:ribonuclease VapC